MRCLVSNSSYGFIEEVSSDKEFIFKLYKMYEGAKGGGGTSQASH